MTQPILPQEGANFKDLGIDPKILSILERAGFTSPTVIQHKSIPTAISGKDIVGIAQTGTGKTIAFSVPMLQRLMTDKGRGLVLVPTRELASQVDEMFRQIGSPLGAKTAVLCHFCKKKPSIYLSEIEAQLNHCLPGWGP